MKRLLSLLLCAALALGLFAGCAEEESPYVPTGNGLADDSGDQIIQNNTNTEQTVTLVYDPDSSLNPFRATDCTNRAIFSLIYQGLFAVDRNYNVSPILCESYNVSADRKTYTFYVIDAMFSDGVAVTAADVAASLKAAQESPWYGGRLQHVSSISSYGDAVVVELDTEMVDLPVLLDIPIVKSSEVNAAQPLGTGPYRFDGDHLRKQAGWWCSADLSINCDTIALREASTTTEIRNCFEQEGVSLVCADPGDYYYADFHSDYELWDCENGLFLYLVCNTDSKVFSNETVRAALTYAIDRDALVESCYHGFARSATLPCSPQSPHYNSSLAAKYGHAPQLFQEALEEAGLSGSSITLLLNGDDRIRVKAGQAIAGMLEEFGLTVTIEKATSETFVKLLGKGNYDLYLAQTRLSPNMDLSAFFGEKTSLNYGGLADPSTYAISLEALANDGNYYTLHEMIMEDGQLCPILFQSYAIYGQRGVFDSLDPARDAVFYYDLGRTMDDALITE